MVVFETAGKLLLFLHLAGAFALAGSLTHNLVIGTTYFWRPANRFKLLRLYAKISAISYTVVFIIGSVIYPNFRVHVRAAWFDTQLPFASALFEIKEHWAAVGLLLAWWYVAACRSLDEKSDKVHRLSVVAGGYVFYLIVWYLIICGYYLTTLRSI